MCVMTLITYNTNDRFFYLMYTLSENSIEIHITKAYNSTSKCKDEP